VDLDLFLLGFLFRVSFRTFDPVRWIAVRQWKGCPKGRPFFF